MRETVERWEKQLSLSIHLFISFESITKSPCCLFEINKNVNQLYNQAWNLDFLLATFNFDMISNVPEKLQEYSVTRNYLGVCLPFRYVSLISYNLEYYSACPCFLDCEIFWLFCRMSFNFGLPYVSSWLGLGYMCLADTTKVIVLSFCLPAIRRHCICQGSQPWAAGAGRGSPSGHTQKLSGHFVAPEAGSVNP